MKQEFLDSLKSRRVVKRPWEELRVMFEQVWKGEADHLVKRTSMSSAEDWTVTRNRTGSVTITIKDPEYSQELKEDARQGQVTSKDIQDRGAEPAGVGRPGLSDNPGALQDNPTRAEGLRSGIGGLETDTGVFHGPWFDPISYDLVNRGQWWGSYNASRRGIGESNND